MRPSLSGVVMALAIITKSSSARLELTTNLGLFRLFYLAQEIQPIRKIVFIGKMNSLFLIFLFIHFLATLLLINNGYNC